MDKIKDHQDLLNRFVISDIGNIVEHSGEIDVDVQKLAYQVMDYVRRAWKDELKFPSELFEGYTISFDDGSPLD